MLHIYIVATPSPFFLHLGRLVSKLPELRDMVHIRRHLFHLFGHSLFLFTKELLELFLMLRVYDYLTAVRWTSTLTTSMGRGYCRCTLGLRERCCRDNKVYHSKRERVKPGSQYDAGACAVSYCVREYLRITELSHLAVLRLPAGYGGQAAPESAPTERTPAAPPATEAGGKETYVHWIQ